MQSTVMKPALAVYTALEGLVSRFVPARPEELVLPSTT